MAQHLNNSSSFMQSSSSRESSGRMWVDNSGPHQASNEPNITHPAYCTDHFRMYEFKVKACPRTRAHDWTQCPFAHPGEKARRRDPRKVNYSAVPCPDYRKGTCKRGDACEYAHGVFECWLHPTRYRTQMCTDKESCRRLVCFFAHNESELRAPTECVACPPSVQEAQVPSSSAVPVGVGGGGSSAANPMDKLASDQLFSLALAHLLALQNQQQQQQQQQHHHHQVQYHHHQQHHQQHQHQQQHVPHYNVHQQYLSSQPSETRQVLQQAILQQSVPYYPQMVKQQHHAMAAMAMSHQGMHPLSPSSPLEADFGPLLQDQAKEKSGFGSMDNLLSSLPRSLSDVGLADAAQS